MASPRSAVIAGAVLATLAAGCSNLTAGQDDAKLERYSGLFRQGFEQSDFYPDDGGGPWWLSYDGDFWTRIEPFNEGAGRGNHVLVRIEVAGELSPVGRHGHLGAYQRELTVERLLSVEAASDAEFEAAAAVAARRD